MIPRAAGCSALAAALKRCAPWRLTETVRLEQERLDRWREAKEGRPRKRPQLPLLVLPGPDSNRHMLVLTVNPAVPEQPTLDVFHLKQVNRRLPEHLWTRPGSDGTPSWVG